MTTNNFSYPIYSYGSYDVGLSANYSYSATYDGTFYYTYRCRDNAGNYSGWSDWTDGIARDTTEPYTYSLNASRYTSSSSWYNGDITFTSTIGDYTS